MMATSSVFSARRRTSPGDSDDTDMSFPRCAPGRRIPSSEWEKKRPVITKLYQEEKRPLKEVMEVLEREHGFTATVKMYKSRIWKWGLDKKLKSDEVLAILILRTEREAQGKISEFTIRGQPVDLDNINRYIRRNPGLVARFRAGVVPSIQTTLEVQCRTPSPTPSHHSLPPPKEISNVEQVLNLFRDYFDTSFTNGAWNHEYNGDCVSLKPGDRSVELFERVVASFGLVNRSMMRKDEISISTLLTPAFESLKEIIASESPVFAVRTAFLLWYLHRFHKEDLLHIVMNYLAGLVPIVLGHDHPMTRIWKIIGSQDFSDHYELSTRLYSSLVPLFEERIGFANSLTTILYCDHIDCLVHHGQTAESLSVATQYRTRAEATQLRHPWLRELAILQTGIMCNAKTAEGKIEEAMQCLQTLKDWDLNEEQQAGMNIQLGNYSYQMGDFSLAIDCFREASRLITASQGDERIHLTCLANLESALRKSGEADEAAQVHELRLTRLSEFARETGTFANLPESCAAAVSPGDSYSWDAQQVSDWHWSEDGHGSAMPTLGLT
ncbi:hypothetical protein NOF04DRAFT_21918 [Fusarium oxysporum II5]|nr:uncharacterized protein FOIG_06591 [Fusarium odoratissimum NRRL 54006]EXM02332.1 hypothetical protein FOIG_06591 [Fusarium odoratissimum NRRL 54006]KAH7211767.1 hypothetical protein DER44DRAFT_766804 [Fusarium oxysporum]KAK2133673.1 hypothetical protein NOF04DRAFT_21918 [Fusarium oxysporum II5]TXC08218.1 hypothetical protein FocTR4_00003891 [Fusarium oxysporum f. sp. cubense]